MNIQNRRVFYKRTCTISVVRSSNMNVRFKTGTLGLIGEESYVSPWTRVLKYTIFKESNMV